MPSSCSAREIIRCALPGGERVLGGVGVLRAADADDDVVAVLGDGLDHFQMPLVERLEPADEQAVARSSSLHLDIVDDSMVMRG